jgi:catechol 2,3-dioxygenase-like lactoylglutathione lyase family enzyme
MARTIITQQITFLHAQNLEETHYFYTRVLGFPLVRDQGSCLIFQATEGAYLGFCQHIEPIQPGRKVILTLVSEDVDGWYAELKESGHDLIDPPIANPKYHIYHFFIPDPNGYWIEIQRFDQPL